MPPLTVIVVTFNRFEYTRRTLESIRKTVPRNTRVIIFDNNSSDEAMISWLKNDWISVDTDNHYLMLSKQNIGWGAAVNEAMKEVKTEYILISNNDVEYKDGWYEECIRLYEKYPKIGVLGVWKHTSHGVREKFTDIWIKDDMPAVGWIMKKSIMDIIGPISEHGPCLTRGGNGEDSNYTIRAHIKGYWVCGPSEDLAIHFDGY